jgi:tetratricopeptide (TPR) repeat protein
MEDKSRFGVVLIPEGRPVSLDELERILRARVAECVEGSKEYREAQWQLMRLLGTTGRQSEGLEILDALLRSSVEPEVQAEIVLAMGQLMETLGDFQTAAESYSRGVALKSGRDLTWYFLHNNLGYCLNQLGRHAEAERWCRAAIEIDPPRYNAHKNLGLACQGQGRYEEAALALIQAVQRNPGDPRALKHLDELVKSHPEIASTLPNIHEQVAGCSRVMGAVRLMRAEEFRKPSDPNSN